MTHDEDQRLLELQLRIERRDHFTAAALMGLLAGRGTWPNDPIQFAEWSVQLGNAAIAELDKVKP